MINEKATEAIKKKLKRTKNVAWKIVEIVGEDYIAPMRWRHVYNRTAKNKVTGFLSFYRGYRIECRGAIAGGVFHFCRTREIARVMLRILKASRCGFQSYKVVKVFYDKKDFFGIGNSVNFSDTHQTELDQYENNAICTTAFTFAK